MATASSEYYMSTRHQPLSNLGTDGGWPGASFRKWSSFRLMRTAKWERCGSTTASTADESAHGVSDPGLCATAKAPLLARTEHARNGAPSGLSMASNFAPTIFSGYFWREMDSGQRPLLIADAERRPKGRPDNRRMQTGCPPDRGRTEAGRTPDGVQVSYPTPDLTRSVRDGVLLQVRS